MPRGGMGYGPTNMPAQAQGTPMANRPAAPTAPAMPTQAQGTPMMGAPARPAAPAMPAQAQGTPMMGTPAVSPAPNFAKGGAVYKHADPAHLNFGQSADSSLLMKKRR